MPNTDVVTTEKKEKLVMKCVLRDHEFPEPGPPDDIVLEFHRFRDLASNNTIADPYQRCWNENFHTASTHIFVQLHAAYIVTARKGDTYCSFAIITERDNESWVDEVMTLREFQKQGIGTLVMQHLLRVANAYGIHELWLDCDPNKNKGKVAKMYEDLGFVPHHREV